MLVRYEDRTMSEIMRMNLIGLEPALYARIKAAAERTIREFDGAPEHAADFQEAQRILRVMTDIEAGQ
jgi:hypothetical protein